MSWLPRDRDPVAFDRACRVGFLMASDMHARAFGRFEAWCRQHGRPLVWIRPRGRWADIVLRMDPCGWYLTDELVEELDFLLDVTTPHSAVMASAGSCTVFGVPIGQSDAVAFRLFERALEGRPDGAQVSGTIV